MDKIKRINQLVLQLNTYRDEYYNKNNPEISDKQYDDMFDELSNLELETGYIPSNSPTQTVGYTVVSKLQKVTHPIPLRSLDKTKNITDINKFMNKVVSLLMLKYDGLTVELDYDGGNLIQGSTRGDGYIGEDITHNVKVFKNVPLHIPFKGFLRVTGEAIIHKDDFDRINANLPDDVKYKNARNLVAGTVRQLDSKICAERNVYFMPWDIIEGFGTDNRFTELQKLNEYGFTPNTDIFYIPTTITENTLSDMFNTLKNKAEVKGIPIDGLVVKYNSIKYSKALGHTSHHNLDGLAFKFYDESEKTTLRNVEWSMGKTNILTPVAIFDTVQIDGTDVSRASLHNISIIKKLKLGINDEISVAKMNMIIPQVTENHTQSNNLEIPVTCPYCGAKTVIQKDNDSEILVCTNSDCNGKKLGRFVNFVSKPAMNIEGLSESTLDKFICKGWLNNFSDIYHLDQYKDEIVHMDGFGIKSYNNLWNSIEKSKNVKLENFIYALGIPNVGKTASKTISEYFKGDWQKFILSFPNNFDWTTLKDFGTVIADSLHNYFCNMNNREEWKSLVDIVIFIKPEQTVKQNDGDVFVGKKLYCTGSFACGKKNELKQMVEDNGGEFASGYAKSLSYLVVGSLKSSSKEDKARKDGVPILTEDEFLKMISKQC